MIKNQKIVRLKNASLETKGEGFQGTIHVEIVANGKSVVYDILGDLNNDHLERTAIDIIDMGRIIAMHPILLFTRLNFLTM